MSFFLLSHQLLFWIICIFTLFFFPYHLRKSPILNIEKKKIYLFPACSKARLSWRTTEPLTGSSVNLPPASSAGPSRLLGNTGLTNPLSHYPKYQFQTLFTLLKNSNPIMPLPILSHGLISYFLNKRAISKNSSIFFTNQHSSLNLY